MITHLNNTSQRHSAIEVLHLTPVSHGNVRAYARVKVGALTISSVKVIQQPGQRPWVKLPDQQNKEGKWFPIVTCSSPTLEQAIIDAVLAAYQDVVVLGGAMRGQR